MSLNQFINNLKITTQTLSKSKKLTIVFGNESCDLDSAISSIAYAFFLNWITHKIPSGTNKSQEDTFIPLLHIPKEELPLKTEVTYSLKKYGVNLSNVLCLDDLNLESLLDNYDLKVILVDHHILSDKTSFLLPYVTKILDHRPRDELNFKYGSAVESNIQIVGSCATLVCSDIFNHENGVQFLGENKDIANLLHGTIILDTANFLPSADRARPLDFKMADELEKILEITDKENYRSTIFNELLKARTDCSSLTSLQLLNRDLKIVNKIPIPGLPMLVGEFLKREDCGVALKTFCKTNCISTIILIGLVVVDNTVQRDLAVYSSQDCELHTKIVESLLSATEPQLDLEKTSQSLNNLDHFVQKNVKASRKQIVPIIKKIIQE